LHRRARLRDTGTERPAFRYLWRFADDGKHFRRVHHWLLKQFADEGTLKPGNLVNLEYSTSDIAEPRWGTDDVHSLRRRATPRRLTLISLSRTTGFRHQPFHIRNNGHHSTSLSTCPRQGNGRDLGRRRRGQPLPRDSSQCPDTRVRRGSNRPELA
jgi:hypothetical protein